MKSVSESAIQKHYLQSILPHPTHPTPKQILKTKQFYKPQQFIWNNPHRASNQIYKFYHAYNDHYQKIKQPQLRQQQQFDRQQNQLKRIQRLRQFRNKARQQLELKTRLRLQLQAKTFNDLPISVKSKQSTSRFLPLHSNTPEINRRFSMPKTIGSQRIIRKIQESYKQGVKKFDEKTQSICKLIDEQNNDYHQKLRSQFAARKQMNQTNKNKFSKGPKSYTQNIQIS